MTTTKPQYGVRCDDCKQPMHLTDSLKASAAGGLCSKCLWARRDATREARKRIAKARVYYQATCQDCPFTTSKSSDYDRTTSRLFAHRQLYPGHDVHLEEVDA